VTQTPAGWYPDPQPQAGHPPYVRWWDGASWTEHAQPAPGAVAVQAPPSERDTTPDGQPLAGWWVRVGAYLIDVLVLVPILVLVSIPFWGHIGDVMGDYFHDVSNAMDNGRPVPASSYVRDELQGTFLLLGLINAAVSFAYSVGMLMWKQATVGKLCLGLRVRLRETPGPMPFSTVAVRWLVQFGPGVVLAQVPFVGSIGGLYGFLDGLWPLWDGRRQALHDKAAKTNVVRIR
jgi:uncharacterized RDD family membrane protein YckC